MLDASSSTSDVALCPSPSLVHVVLVSKYLPIWNAFHASMPYMPIYSFSAPKVMHYTNVIQLSQMVVAVIMCMEEVMRFVVVLSVLLEVVSMV